MADDGDRAAAVVAPEVLEPVLMRTWAKPPKEYKYGTDFRTYAHKFAIYCDLNNIPERQRAPLLFTLLDSKAFNIAQNLPAHTMAEIRLLVEALIQKFDPPAGAPGN